MERTGRHRKIAREIAFRTLYSYDFRKEDDIFEILEEHIAGVREEIPSEALDYAYKILDRFIEATDNIDMIIEHHLEKWRLKRLGYPERALLRLGTTELIFLDILDKGRVFIDIIDLTYCYIGNEESVRFINGVLSSIFKKNNKDKEEAENLINNINIDEYIENNIKVNHIEKEKK